MSSPRIAAVVLTCALSVLSANKAGAQARDNARQPGSVELDKYKVVEGPTTLHGLTEDASGIACIPTGGFLVVINGATQLAEYDAGFHLRRKIRMEGFEDTEDLAFVDGNKLAIVEERKRRLVLVDFPPKADSIPYPSASSYEVESNKCGNVGFEGVAWDARGKRFFIVKEKQPPRIYEVKLDGGKARISHPWNLEEKNFGFTDFSGIFFDPKTGHLLILSDESKSVVETTTDGKEISRLVMKQGSAGLKADLVQPEGIALAPDGKLYICCEPNILYVFDKAPAR